jgi:hypothetical protein
MEQASVKTKKSSVKKASATTAAVGGGVAESSSAALSSSSEVPATTPTGGSGPTAGQFEALQQLVYGLTESLEQQRTQPGSSFLTDDELLDQELQQNAGQEQIGLIDLELLDGEGQGQVRMPLASQEVVVSNEVEDDLPQVRFAGACSQGPPISENLAMLVNKAVFTATEKSAIDELIARYPAPSNCDNLVVPAVNQAVWGLLPRHLKSQDLGFRFPQSQLVSGIAAVSSVFTDLKTAGDSSYKPLLKVLGEAVLLLSACTQSLSIKRRELLKPALRQDLKSLCTPNIPLGTELFGTLHESVKDLQSSRNLLKPQSRGGSGVYRGANASAYRFTPYNRGFRGAQTTGQCKLNLSRNKLLASQKNSRLRCESLPKQRELPVHEVRTPTVHSTTTEVVAEDGDKHVSSVAMLNSPFPFAGRLRLFQDAWRDITQNQYIIECVNGIKIKNLNNPIQSVIFPLQFSATESKAIDKEINILIAKGAIVQVEHCLGEHISNIFTRPKPNGSLRVILNLKKLNTFVAYEHFKMDHLANILPLIQQICFFLLYRPHRCIFFISGA